MNESGKIRRTVQLGIEKIRAVDQRHGLQAQLLIYLANAFGSKVSGSIIIQRTLGFCVVVIPIATAVTMMRRVSNLKSLMLTCFFRLKCEKV